MSRYFFVALMVVSAAALLGLAIAANPGYVLIAYPGFLYEAGLWTTLLLIVLVVLAVVVLRLVLLGTAASGGWLNPWSRRHRERRLAQAARLGLLELAEGRWEPALRHLSRAAEAEERPLVMYLGAARAANELRQFDKADALLARALEREPKAQVAVGLARARLLIDRGELELALQLIHQLDSEHPHHPQVLRLEQRLLVELQRWDELCRLLPELRRRHVLDDAALIKLERVVWSNALARAGDEQALEALRERWKRAPASLRKDPQVLGSYVLQLDQHGLAHEAVPLLAAAIAEHYQAALVYLYGRLRGSDAARQLQQAESWLKQHPDDAVLLLTLGRLCMHNQLWGKARDYFEASLRLERRAEACAELANLLQQQGDGAQSNALYREAIQLAQGQERLTFSGLLALKHSING